MPMSEPLATIAVLELGSAWMLGWLAAAGIPLALHLLHRRRQQEIPWAAMELLLQAIRQNSRTVHIEQWLLLLLRTCALILLAVALARPILRGSAGTEAVLSLPPKLWVIVLDASYSMNYTPQRQSSWELAQQRAAELVRQAGPGDAFTLIELASPSTAVIAQPAFESARVLEEIQRLKCTDGGGDLPSCLELIRQTLADARQSAPQQQDVQIVFFTDLGRDSWQTATAGNHRRLLQELAGEHALRIESLAPQSPSNVAVTGFDTDTLLVLKGRSLKVSATIQNFGTRALQRLPVQFQSEGRTLHTEFVDCPAGASRTVTADMQPPQSRYWTAGVAIPSDHLAIDNRRDLIVSVRPQVRVVTIEETPGAAKLVNLSLAPQSDSPTAPIVVESWLASELMSRSLADIDAVILVDVADLNAGIVANLRNFVDTGGAVLALAGPRAQTSSWNRSVDSFGELVGFDLVEPSASSDWHVDPLGYASPIARPFANFQDAGLLTTPIFRYWKIAPRAAANLQIDLGFTSGEPWLVRRALGSGWAAALLSAPQSGTQTGSPPDHTWNAMATWPSFVPIMQKIIETIIGGAEQEMNVNVGEPLVGAIDRQTRPAELTIHRPDNSTSRLTIPPATETNRQSWIYAATDLAGVYRAVVNDGSDDEAGTESGRPYAVNIVPSQSDLQSVPLTALPLSSRTPPLEPRAATLRPGDDAAPSPWISRWCLVALLAMLACESILAWNLGRRLT